MTKKIDNYYPKSGDLSKVLEGIEAEGNKKVLVIDDQIGAPCGAWHASFARDYAFDDIKYEYSMGRDKMGYFSPEAAIDFVKKHSDAQAILLDLNFGSKTMGYDILEKLREEQIEIPVAMITGQSDKWAREKCRKYGVKDFLKVKDDMDRNEFYQKLTDLIVK